jgi:hypothetical protein
MAACALYMDEASFRVFKTYADFTSTKLILRVLRSERPYVSLLVLGQPGIGKTSYIYYSFKAARMLSLCRNSQKFELGACLSFLESNYGEVCLSRNCTKPDALDEKYMWSYYTGLADLKRFIEDYRALAAEVRRGERPGKRVFFLDDLVSRKAYAFGGVYRDLYMAFKEVYRIIRLAGGVVLMTGIHKSYFPEEAVATSEVVIGRWGMGEILFQRWTIGNIKSKFGDWYFRRPQKKWEDVVPRRGIYGLPQWLEREINARKAETAIDIVDRALAKYGGEFGAAGGKAAEPPAAVEDEDHAEEPPARSSRAERLARVVLNKCRPSNSFASFKACVEALTRRDKDAFEVIRNKVLLALLDKGVDVDGWEDLAKLEGSPAVYL